MVRAGADVELLEVECSPFGALFVCAALSFCEGSENSRNCDCVVGWGAAGEGAR